MTILRPNRAKQLLREGKVAVGAWAGLGSPAVVEALCQQDLDWILLDGEHGLASTDNAVSLLQAMNGAQPTALVRVPTLDPGLIGRWLDLGVEGVLLPRVTRVSQVEAAVAATRYPPAGSRGIGPSRAAGWGSRFPAYYARGADEILVLAQVETLEAVESMEDLAGIDGLDGLFVGPADLSAALGHFPETQHEEVEAVVRRMVEVCRRHGKAAGYFCENGEAARERIEQGFTVVNACSDISVLAAGTRLQVKAARGS